MSVITYATSTVATLGPVAMATNEILRQIYILCLQAFTALDIATQALVASYLGKVCVPRISLGAQVWDAGTALKGLAWVVPCCVLCWPTWLLRAPWCSCLLLWGSQVVVLECVCSRGRIIIVIVVMVVVVIIVVNIITTIIRGTCTSNEPLDSFPRQSGSRHLPDWGCWGQEDKRSARELIVRTVHLGLFVGACIASGLMLTRQFLPTVFTTDAAVRLTAAAHLPIIAFYLVRTPSMATVRLPHHKLTACAHQWSAACNTATVHARHLLRGQQENLRNTLLHCPCSKRTFQAAHDRADDACAVAAA